MRTRIKPVPKEVDAADERGQLTMA